jgi:hypothetical protein
METKHYRVTFYTFHKYNIGRLDLLLLEEDDYGRIIDEVDQQVSIKYSEFDIVGVEVTRCKLVEDDIKGVLYEVKAKIKVHVYR